MGSFFGPNYEQEFFFWWSLLRAQEGFTLWRAEISLNELNERLWEIRVAYTGRRITLVLSMLFTTSSSAYVGACNELDGMLQSYDFMRLELAGVAPMSRMCADPLRMYVIPLAST